MSEKTKRPRDEEVAPPKKQDILVKKARAFDKCVKIMEVLMEKRKFFLEAQKNRATLADTMNVYMEEARKNNKLLVEQKKLQKTLPEQLVKVDEELEKITTGISSVGCHVTQEQIDALISFHEQKRKITEQLKLAQDTNTAIEKFKSEFEERKSQYRSDEQKFVFQEKQLLCGILSAIDELKKGSAIE